MHIPEGVLESPAVIAGTWVLAGGGIAWASRSFVTDLGEERSALVGVLGAFVFAAQMVNFPIPATAVSAHLTGTTLLTVFLGPAAAIVVASAVLLVQALLFQDGGIIVYGANVFNLAICPAMVSAALLRSLPATLRHRAVTVGILGVAGVAISSVACGLELVFGSGLDPTIVVTGLLTVQGFVAIGEGVISAIAFASIRELIGGQTPLWPRAGGA